MVLYEYEGVMWLGGQAPFCCPWVGDVCDGSWMPRGG
jgi:hypothetical protein